MTGMGTSPGAAEAFLAAAFGAALLRQLAVIAVIALLLLAAWTVLRWRWPAPEPGGGAAEPPARRVLRVGFGVLWLLDAALQLQPAMPAGLADQVIRPAAAGSPGWVQSLVTWASALWDYHPVTAAAAAVWIQAGVGLALLVAARGRWSRLAGLACAGWGLAVWVFGEAFGGIFAPGASALFGAPGAALLYAVAGALLALPVATWRSRRVGRALLAGTGACLLLAAVAQAWPSSRFWDGTVAGKPGPLASMIGDMASTSQPRILAALLTGFGNLARAHAAGVNLVAVLVFGAGGAALCVLSVRPGTRGGRAAVTALAVCSVVIWVLFQDLGFFGGLGTDPNSMLPLILLVAVGYLALAPQRAEQSASQPAEPPVTLAETQPGETPPDETPPGARVPRVPGYALATAGALAVALVGAVPMAAASAAPSADPVVAEANSGQVSAFSEPAPGFTLTSQRGRPVALSALRGKTVLLTFLDPVCTTDCPLIAREMFRADQQLGPKARGVELVAVVANPTYLSTSYTRAFDRQEGLDTVPNWLYLTGSLGQLQKVWDHYGVQVADLPAGGMASHDDLAFVISPQGVIRSELNADPGPGTAATTSSFSALMADSVSRVMRGNG